MTLRLREGVAGYSGLVHCGSVWACPVCGARIRWRRAIEVGQVLAGAVEQGRPLAFLTLTMRHHEAQALAVLWRAAAKGWSRSTTGRRWVSESVEVDGWVRVWEVTYGVNGWHVHVHAVLILNDSIGWKAVPEGMYRRWSSGLVSRGLEAPLLVGQDWHLVEGEQAAEEVAGYLVKLAEDPGFALGGELAYSSAGRARAGLKTVPPFALLDRLVETGEVEALHLWHEWEEGSHGKHQIGYSRGLRKRYRLDNEAEDQAIVDEAIGSDEDDLVAWNREGWGELVKHPERMSELLDLAALGGAPAVMRALDEWSIPWFRP